MSSPLHTPLAWIRRARVASLEDIKDANEMPLLDGAPRAAVRDRLRASALEERGATGLAEHTCIQGAGGFGALVLAPVMPWSS
jgi:hypothetical protein